MTVTFDESAGLRQTLLAHLPDEIGEALSTLVSYLYDQAVAEGDPPGKAGYIEREAAALVADLRYVEARMSALAEIGEQTSLSADEVPLVARAAAGVSHLRRALQDLVPREEEGDRPDARVGVSQRST